MRKLFVTWMASVALLMLSSCTETKESYIKDFDAFIEEVKADAAEYTDADWEKVQKEYVEFAEAKYEKFSAELTSDEMIEVTKLKAAYLAVRAKQGLNDALDKGSKALDDLLK